MEETRLPDDEIRRFWTAQAEEHGLSPAASWSDVRVIELEVATISGYLTDGNYVLDAGCANGWSSQRYAEHASIDVVGVDYVPEMIASAEVRRRSLPGEVASRLDFRVGDVTSLEFPDDEFDRVVSTRVLINLGSWERQVRGLREYARVLRRGGVLLLSEATVEGSTRLNALRAEWGLEPIPTPSFNRYLEEGFVVEELAPELELLALVDFASSYYVATRVLKPLLARATSTSLDVADPRAEFNRWAASLPPAGDYGTQKLFVFEKR